MTVIVWAASSISQTIRYSPIRSRQSTAAHQLPHLGRSRLLSQFDNRPQGRGEHRAGQLLELFVHVRMELDPHPANWASSSMDTPSAVSISSSDILR